MPCIDAMITEIISIRPDNTVSEILALFDKHGIRAVPVLGEDDKVVGKISFADILNRILPVPVTLEGSLRRLPRMDISLAHISGGTPWVTKRLHRLLPRTAAEIMVKEPRTVNPETPLREGVRLLSKYGSPILVVEEDSGKLAGLISSQTVIKRLLELEKELPESGGGPKDPA